jgi:hypothetical protein
MIFSPRNRNKLIKPGPSVLNLQTLAACLAVLTLTGMFYAYSSIYSLNISYQVSRELEVQRELAETGRRLKLEFSNLRSPARLERQGAALGLVLPEPRQVRKLAAE